MSDGDVSVKVAIRVRPQSPREIIDCCRICTNFVPGEPQIILGSDKAFTYDKVFEMSTGQREIYEATIKELVESCFKGYNSTILAYGQTGSGKTYTMGTQFDECIREQQRGLIPRAVDHLFQNIRNMKEAALAEDLPPPDFKVSAQFMELYNEEILDLLSPSGEAKGKKSNLKIHEDANGEIYVDGMSSQDVANTEEVLLCLQQGALCRTTASTQMNAVSSRSHALFSLKMHIMKALKTEDGSSEFENLTSKLVFVDLAGSERLKRTGATGDRAKEGISINGGLLALGNVISALGDEKRKAAHVPYRDSKLTRLLQDSLGGNSQTLMVACVSPSDRDFMETLNTLKYANRAKNIKNKVVVNQDKTSRMINMLREENMKLQQELMEYRMGQRTGEEGNYSDLFTENAMLRADNDKLRLRIKSMKEAQDTKDENIAELRAKAICASVIGSDETDMTEMIQGYMKEIESLRTQLLEQETAAKYRSPVKPGAVAPAARLSLNASGGGAILNDSIVDVIKEAKDDLEKTMAKRSKLAHLMDLEQTKVEDNKENILEEEEEEEEENEEEEMDCENNFIDIDDDMEDITTIKSEKEKPQEGGGEEEEEEEAKHRIENIHIIEQDLADLGDEISIKQKLLEELERSQKKIHNLKMVYEEKLNTLQNMMRQTCDERDEVLENLRKNSDSNKNKEEIKSKGDHYTKKIKDMEKEMKRLRTAKLEHEKMEKKSKAQEKQLKDIQTEITNMKRNKVKLMRQLKEEIAKSKKVEQKKQQEIVKLQREKQKQNTQIKKLQMEQKTKDMVLKRKQEEIKMMKKQKNALSVKKLHNSVRNRPGVMRNQASAVAEQEQEDDRNGRRLSSQYSSFSARQKWNQLERRINQNIIRKHTVAHMEAEMDRLVKDRERLEKDLDQFIKKKDKILKGKDPNGEELQELDENIEGLSAQVEYLQENINEHQTHIVEMMDGRESGDTLDLQDIIDNCSLPDCKYLLEHFLSFTTTKGLAAAQSNIKVKEVEATVKSLRQALEETEQKLVDQYNVAEKQIEVKEEDEKDNVEDAVLCNASMFNTPSKTYSMLCATPGRKFFPQPSSASPPITETRLAAVLEDKVLRRRTGTPVEFQSPLTGSRESIGSDSQLMPPPAVTLTAEDEPPPRESKRVDTRKTPPRDPIKLSPSPVRGLCKDVSPSASPSLERRDSVRRRNGGGSLGSTTDNVFERLHSQTDEPAPEGHVVPCDEKTSHPQISCVSLVKGHTHSVQSVSVHGKIMVTGSSDRTIRIWDLSDGKEAQRASFSDPVKKVVYSTGESVVYALTNQCLKAWDIRTDPKTCRSTTLAEFPSALLYPPGSDFIYFSTGISVRSWNVGQWTAAGVLHGHSGHVMCLEYVQFDDKKYIITGSRDHFCKIYDARDGIISSRVPTATLNPPHFDGIESIVCVDEHLYSGSRDATIKKWHLPSKKEKGAQRPAHKDRVQALTYVPTLSGLASVSRNGSLKVWSEENFGAAKSDHSKSLIAEVNAHPGSSINDVTFHDDHVFTASGDTTVKIWAVK